MKVFGETAMSQSEAWTILVIWTIGGAVLGWIAWRALSRPKYLAEKVVQGIVGAHLFGWIALISVPRSWQYLAPHIVALVMGFLLPRWDPRNAEEPMGKGE